MPPRGTRRKKPLAVISGIAEGCRRQAPKLKTQAQRLHQELKKVRRGVGRQCRGQGHGFLTWVRQTERQLLALGQPRPVLGQQAQHLLEQAADFNEAHREGLALKLTTALGAPAQIRQHSGRYCQLAELPNSVSKLQHGHTARLRNI